MKRWLFCAVVLVGLAQGVRAQDESGGDVSDQQTGLSQDEAEERGILPPMGTSVSSAPVTPITSYAEKSSYQEALDLLTHATDLWNRGLAEAASDMALEAYDDLVAIHRARHVRRATLRKQRHKAASLYIVAGIATIKAYVKDRGHTAAAVTEGRERLDDLRDVSKDYPELNHLVTTARLELK